MELTLPRKATLPFYSWPTVFGPPLLPTLPLSLTNLGIMLPRKLASLARSFDAPAFLTQARKVGFDNFVFSHIFVRSLYAALPFISKREKPLGFEPWAGLLFIKERLRVLHQKFVALPIWGKVGNGLQVSRHEPVNVYWINCAKLFPCLVKA